MPAAGRPAGLPLTSTSSLLAGRGTVTTRKWFRCKESLPSKIFRVCLPGPQGNGRERGRRGQGPGWDMGPGKAGGRNGGPGAGWGVDEMGQDGGGAGARRRQPAKGHSPDSGPSASLPGPAGALASGPSSPSPAGCAQGPCTRRSAPTQRPPAAAPLTWLRGRALGDAETVHLAEVAGQQAHACGGQDHCAQAPESALGGKRRGADRVSLGVHVLEPGAFGQEGLTL